MRQLDADTPPHDELGAVQRGAEGTRIADDVAPPGYAMAHRTERQALGGARAQADAAIQFCLSIKSLFG